jgi:hypothetical protein
MLHAPLAAAACGQGFSNPITAENCNTASGTWSTEWKADRTSYAYDNRVLAGYASHSSVKQGERLNLYIQSPQTPPGYSIVFYRLG